MNRKMLLGLYVVSLLLQGCSDTTQGPLGLKMGMSKEELLQAIPSAAQVPGKPYNYWAPNVGPVDGPFKDYLFGVGSSTGLCTISATSDAIENDDDGKQIRQRFETAMAQIQQKYGKGQRFEKATGEVEDRRGFMLELFFKTRSLYAIWDADLDSKLPGELSHIRLMVDGKNELFKARLMIVYRFKNAEKCDELGNGVRLNPV